MTKSRVVPVSDSQNKPFPEFPSGLDRAGVDREFARRINVRMRQLGYHQSQLAKEAANYMPDGNFGRDLVSNYCRANGKGKLPNPPHLKALAKALDMAPGNLLPPVFPSIRASTIRDPLPPTSMENLTDGTTRVKLNLRVPTKVALQIMTLALENDLDQLE